jgi:hypothetical protein
LAALLKKLADDTLPGAKESCWPVQHRIACRIAKQKEKTSKHGNECLPFMCAEPLSSNLGKSIASEGALHFAGIFYWAIANGSAYCEDASLIGAEYRSPPFILPK